MGMPATRFGDRDQIHCAGSRPTRAEASESVFVNGRGWSRLGDMNCTHEMPGGDRCVNHAAPIGSASNTVFVNGRGAGRKNDPVLGCTHVVEGSENVICG